jgi:hypothetical protein
MFLQLARNPASARNLFQRHPRFITALVEHYWDNRADLPRIAWRAPATQRIAAEFGVALPPGPFNNHWDHMIYAYLIENTRIYDIFVKVLKTYRSGEQLGRPDQSRQFWDTTECLFFNSPPPTTVWNVTSSVRPDEVSQRMLTYWWMFGLPLAHTGERAQAHSYQKPIGANVEFIPAFEAFASEVRRGIINRRNRTGVDDTDNQAIATEAQRIHHMLETRRLNGNLLREEFRAVAVMSWLHLAVSFDSPVVVDLSARASSPEQRLCNIAERVGMTAHPKSQALFNLAQPFSLLLRWIEGGQFDTTPGAERLYTNNALRGRAEVVIGQYSLAMGRDLKAIPVKISAPAPAPEQLPPPRPVQLVPASRQLA